MSARPSAVHASRSSQCEQPRLIGDDLDRRARLDQADSASQVRTRGATLATEAHLPESVARVLGDQHVGGIELVVAVDGEHRGRGRGSGHDRNVSERRRERDHRTPSGTIGGAHARATREVAREHRAGERDVGNRAPECVGNDRRLDPAGERCTVSPVVAQLEPPGVAHGHRQPLDAHLIGEPGDGSGPELSGQLPRRATKLRLLRRVARIHQPASRFRP